ncbi:MAG: CDP-diacylglycerol--serine O-phosphatidyltransferase [Gemmatimonadaceae bacterium]
MRRPRLPRPSMIMLPNGFTLANLFFGVFAIVTAVRGDHALAVWFIIIGAICDAIDGRVARATNTGSRFGEELDSLVDAISFGFAPPIMMYFAVLRRDGLDWVFVFLFSACAVMRLARFNVEQAGRKKTYYRGLPSPVAGGVLATYYWFSQTAFYNETVISDLPWHTMVRFLMAGLAFLMISNVPYPVIPTFNLKTLRGALGLIVLIGLVFGMIFLPKDFFFPVGMLYVTSGVVAAVLRGLLDRPPHLAGEPDGNDENLFEQDDADDDDDDDEAGAREGRRRRRRRFRGQRHKPDRTLPEEPTA